MTSFDMKEYFYYPIKLVKKLWTVSIQVLTINQSQSNRKNLIRYLFSNEIRKT